MKKANCNHNDVKGLNTFGHPMKWYNPNNVNPVSERRNGTDPKPFGGVDQEFIKAHQKPAARLADIIDKDIIKRFKDKCKDVCEADIMYDVDENAARQLERLNAPSKKIAEAHWGYIESLLGIHEVDPEAIEIIRFHYISSFIHGWKHGVDERLD